jgi:hypothetical protein
MNKTKFNKRKRLLKKTKKNKKYYGGIGNVVVNNDNQPINNDNQPINKEKEGIIDSLKNKITNMAVSTGDYIGDKALRLVGLQPIKQSGELQEASSNQINQKIGEISDATSNIISDVKNIANRTSTALIGNVNEVLGSPQVSQTLTQATQNFKNIVENQLENINTTLNDPKFKEATQRALDNVSDYAEIGVKAMNKPIDEAIDKLNESGEKAISGALSGSIKVATDALAAVPGAGAIVETGKIINDVSKAASSVIEAGTEAVSTLSNLYVDTSENISNGLKELEKKKQYAANIANRTSESINQFENPIEQPGSKEPINNKQQTGGKTKKRLFNNKKKSKRVRFAL